VSVGDDAGVLPPLPYVRQPLVELADGRGREVGQKLREIELPTAGAGDRGEDCGGASAAFVADEQEVLPLMPISA